MTELRVQASSPTPMQDCDATILLVDDDAFILEAVGSLLTRLGYLPEFASTGEEALAKLGAGLEPTLVILDMDMPGMGGALALPRIRALRPELPIVISTGRITTTVTDLVKRHPYVSLLPKPYGLQELRAKLA